MEILDAASKISMGGYVLYVVNGGSNGMGKSSEGGEGSLGHGVDDGWLC